MITVKIHTCCPQDDCTCYRDTANFLQSWGVEQNIGVDDHGHFFEIEMPNDPKFQDALVAHSLQQKSVRYWWVCSNLQWKEECQRVVRKRRTSP